MTSPTKPARVTAVKPLGGYRLRVGFSDGSSREVDLESELWGPVFEPLRDPALFRQVAVDDELGTVVWPNGADLDPDVLHGDHAPAKDAPRATMVGHGPSAEDRQAR
jgi:hypothetical protein